MFLPLNTFENICVCFLLLMIYSTIGWVAEMIYHSIVIGHMSEKRGFLNGFLCPIYGHGALLVLYVLHGGLKNPILTFLAGMVLTSALEYFTSWIMEALFHMRWWDYSNCKYQLNGRVCLTNTFSSVSARCFCAMSSTRRSWRGCSASARRIRSRPRRSSPACT